MKTILKIIGIQVKKHAFKFYDKIQLDSEMETY